MMTKPIKPIIMTATMGKADFAWADGLRRQYYPPGLNRVDAHITLFHHLPPQALDEIREAVKSMTSLTPPPKSTLSDILHLGSGVAYRVRSPGLVGIRMELAEMFHGLLVAQDQQRPRLHITVQNKVSPHEAKQLLGKLVKDFKPRPLSVTGLALNYYMNGPWEKIGNWPFRG